MHRCLLQYVIQICNTNPNPNLICSFKIATNTSELVLSAKQFPWKQSRACDGHKSDRIGYEADQFFVSFCILMT